MRAKLMAASMLAAITLLGSAAISPSEPDARRYDVLVRNGTIFDGSGRPGFRGDVGIVEGRIEVVGDLAGATAATVIDATGRFVAPGFVNIHDHPTSDGLVRARNMLTQGVTTEIFNADGGVSAPPGTDPTDLDKQLRQMSARGLATNIGGAIGFNAVWEAVMGSSPRRATAQDVARMQAMVDQALLAGAFGVSAGLDYKPGYYASAAEATAVASAASRWRTNYPNHERLTPESGFSSLAGAAETIEIASKAGLAPVITHIKVQGKEQGRAAELLAMMAAATKAGHYTSGDVYPYVAGQSGLAWLLVPGWAQEGGRDAMLARFRDKTIRARIARETEAAMAARFGGPEGVYVVDLRRQLSDLIKERATSPGETILQLLEKADMRAILRFGAERDIITFMRDPAVAIACDCGARADAATHPRQTGTFPRVLGRYVREQKQLTWEEAIRKMTALPSAIVGLVDRGYLAPGMAADIAVFDPRTIIDRSTFDEPAAFSTGVTEVIVNGRVAMQAGRLTGAQGGQVLRRSSAMPTRPVNTTRRSLLGEGRLATRTGLLAGPGTLTVRYNVRQESADRTAQGSFVVTGPRRPVLTMEQFGMLQAMPGWASFTGTARKADGSRVGVVVTIDQADPLARSGQEIVAISGSGLMASGSGSTKSTIYVR